MRQRLLMLLLAAAGLTCAQTPQLHLLINSGWNPVKLEGLELVRGADGKYVLRVLPVPAQPVSLKILPDWGIVVRAGEPGVVYIGVDRTSVPSLHGNNTFTGNVSFNGNVRVPQP